MTRTWIALSLASLFGCAGGRDEHNSGTAGLEIDDAALASCTAGFVRARECTNQYIPALVDTRVRLNIPAGIADMDREMGRPALVQEAMSEWANDSTDPAIAAVCEKMATERPEKLRPYLDGANACLEAATCDAYVACVMPLQEAAFTSN